ncbi:MAG: D-alanine--D-alanine ligase [Clostridiales bacterium]|nr:D-alanine--D-alanine ligase [Clostridiales bacterium]
MRKISVCVLFGGVSPEHEVSLRSAEAVLQHMNPEKYEIYPVGITKQGIWYLFGGKDYHMLPDGRWQQHPANKRVLISPVRGEGMLIIEAESVVRQQIDVVFPVLHGENGEDGAVQGLMQLAGIACVGPGVGASAASMNKCMTKLVADFAGVCQADWMAFSREEIEKALGNCVEQIQARFAYPVFVKPAGTGSSVGVHKAADAAQLASALQDASRFDQKVLVEEFIDGQEVEVAVLGNGTPAASICGEIDAGAEFYDYDAKYISDCSKLYIPARISDAAGEEVREAAVRIYRALGCRGLSRVDFFVTREHQRAVFNEINTIPGFTSISMYPKLFEASGITFGELVDRLLQLAMEEQ